MTLVHIVCTLFCLSVFRSCFQKNFKLFLWFFSLIFIFMTTDCSFFNSLCSFVLFMIFCALMLSSLLSIFYFISLNYEVYLCSELISCANFVHPNWSTLLYSHLPAYSNVYLSLFFIFKCKNIQVTPNYSVIIVILQSRIQGNPYNI